MTINKLPLDLSYANCYIAADEKSGKAVIIDVPVEGKAIADYVKKLDYSIDGIFLTHGHYDHIAGLSEIKDITGAPIYIHENGSLFLKDREYNLSHYAGLNLKPMEADVLLKDGDVINIGALEIKVLHTPGHTSDSICLLVDDTVFSGDTLFNMSVGRADLPTGNMLQQLKAIETKLLSMPDNVVVYPGHGASTTIGKERRENPYLR